MSLRSKKDAEYEARRLRRHLDWWDRMSRRKIRMKLRAGLQPNHPFPELKKDGAT
jgi:hypothetical protein